MKTLVLFITLLITLANVHMAQAGIIDYNVTLIFTDDTTFRGSFEYNAENQQITNLHGKLDDVLMGNIETIKYQLGSGSDGRGGITAYAFAENTSVIGTNPPLNNNVGVAINFKATNPTLGVNDPGQLAYMDCSPGGLMGKYLYVLHFVVEPTGANGGGARVAIPGNHSQWSSIAFRLFVKLGRKKLLRITFPGRSYFANICTLLLSLLPKY